MGGADPNAKLSSIGEELEHEIDKIKGSRFLAAAAPVASEDEALAFVARREALYPQASHHCWAFRLGREGERVRSSDAGEPGGSAGAPIARHIGGQQLTQVAVVVTRWFGGTKLGVGGLIRAYGEATAAVLERAERIELVITRPLTVRHDYGLTTVIDAWLAAWSLEARDASWGAAVRFEVDVREEDYDGAMADLRERTGGRATIE